MALAPALLVVVEIIVYLIYLILLAVATWIALDWLFNRAWPSFRGFFDSDINTAAAQISGWLKEWLLYEHLLPGSWLTVANVFNTFIAEGFPNPQSLVQRIKANDEEIFALTRAVRLLFGVGLSSFPAVVKDIRRDLTALTIDWDAFEAAALGILKVGVKDLPSWLFDTRTIASDLSKGWKALEAAALGILGLGVKDLPAYMKDTRTITAENAASLNALKTAALGQLGLGVKDLPAYMKDTRTITADLDKSTIPPLGFPLKNLGNYVAGVANTTIPLIRDRVDAIERVSVPDLFHRVEEIEDVSVPDLFHRVDAIDRTLADAPDLILDRAEDLFIGQDLWTAAGVLGLIGVYTDGFSEAIGRTMEPDLTADEAAEKDRTVDLTWAQDLVNAWPAAMAGGAAAVFSWGADFRSDWQKNTKIKRWDC